MSSLLNNFKRKAAEVGSKTKDFVELNKLNSAISQKEDDIRKEYEAIGRVYYKCYKQNAQKSFEGMVEESTRKIAALEEEKKSFSIQIMQLKNEKNCPECMNLVQADIKFCPKCGYKFEFPSVDTADTED